MVNYEIIDKEILVKGKCYVICRDLEGEDVSVVFDSLCMEAFSHGAERVYITCKDKSFNTSMKQFETKDYIFYFYTDMDTLYKKLTKHIINTGLSLVPLNNDNKIMYMECHNEAFYDVPNSMTIDEAEISRIFEDNSCEAGLIYENGIACGTYELDFSEEIPEIAAISVNTKHQKRGYGKKVLIAIEEYLYAKGYSDAELMVASINNRAYSLYLGMNYKFKNKYSCWYEAIKK